MKIGVSPPVLDMENDLGVFRASTETAEALAFTYLRVPGQRFRAGSGHLHEPMTLKALGAEIGKTLR